MKTTSQILLLLLLWTANASADPAWWAARGVVDTNAAAQDYGVAVQGQLKWFATNAYLELEEHLPGGAGTNVEELVQSLVPDDDFCVLTLGQLKAVVAPFYDRLIDQGVADAYPWTTNTADDADYAVALLGQLKYAFDFDFEADVDNDEMPDWWELQYFGDLDETGSGDADGDTVSNLTEYSDETDPTDAESRRNLVVYVDAGTGDDSYDGLAAEVGDGHGPKETIGAGVDVSLSGDTVRVAGGTYSEDVTLCGLNIEVVGDGAIAVE